MRFDLQIKISTGNSRKATMWPQMNIHWSEFVDKLSKPQRTEETLAEYKSWPKPKQDELKDVGGFVGGTLTDGRRRNSSAGERYLITLDADTIEPGGTQRIINVVSGLGCAYAIYSTRKHEGAAPRLRIIFPTDRPCSADEYEAVSRKLASFIDINVFDPTTFEAVRLMYWPSCSKDSEYVFLFGDKPFLSVDGILGMYQDWKNIEEWPQVPGAVKLRDRSAKKQGDPLSKTGVVGAFCRTYSIEDAMAAFIPDAYDPAGDGRYTLVGGSTVGGAVIYEDRFIYSHHATDPCSGKLCNAFDMVRLHMFGGEDVDALPDTPTNRLPSYAAMCEFAMSQNGIRELIVQEKIEGAADAFAQLVDGQGMKEIKQDMSWTRELDMSEKGNFQSTVGNVHLILAHDARFLQAQVWFEEFTGRAVVYGTLPGSTRTGPRKWDDTDDSWLVEFLSKYFKIKGDTTIHHGFNLYLEHHRRHIVKDYLSSLVWDGVSRLDTLLPEYLGTADNEYTRKIMRISMCAAVARVFQPGTKFDSMMVIYGRQGIGKSTFPRMLAGDEWFSDNLAITDMRDKTGTEKLQGYLIIEVPELAGMYNADLEATKSFIARTVDVFRPAYGRNTIERPRQCIFIGTTNRYDFLKDKTGNRRFWPVEAGVVPAVKNVFIQLRQETPQIWAEAVVRYRAGEPLYLSKELSDFAVGEQEKHTERDPREGQILEFVNRKITPDWYQRDICSRKLFWGLNGADSGTVERTQICAKEIWSECLQKDDDAFNKKEARWINEILEAMPGWRNARIDVGKGYTNREYGYRKMSIS